MCAAFAEKCFSSLVFGWFAVVCPRFRLPPKFCPISATRSIGQSVVRSVVAISSAMNSNLNSPLDADRDRVCRHFSRAALGAPFV